MATMPYFVFSPTTVVSFIGLLRGPDPTKPTPGEDWQQAVIDVVIPALNEEEHIVLCLASVARQTRQPRQVILVDDGSRDRTAEYAKAFAERIGLNLIAIKRREPIGKTPTLKRQAREFDADVELILDGDTVLESDNYIERIVQELYQGVGIASACGTVLPMRERDRKHRLTVPPVSEFLAKHPEMPGLPRGHLLHRFDRAITNIYRSVLYTYLQRFLYHGQMAFFGTITNPVGCAVAYRRKYLKDMFDQYEPTLGDDLTNSEDIFIGFALLDQGYRNIQVADVRARSIEPEIQNLPKQIYFWSSSFLQSCYYFNELVRSPLIAFKRMWHRHEEKHDKELKKLQDMRKIKEQYRQAFGIAHTRKYGRPMGWVLFTAMLEKVFFPTALLIMLILQLWEPLAITVVAETAVSTAVLTYVAKGERLAMFFKSLVVTPIRYASLLFDLFTMSWFVKDLWITRNRRWRK